MIPEPLFEIGRHVEVPYTLLDMDTPVYGVIMSREYRPVGDGRDMLWVYEVEMTHFYGRYLYVEEVIKPIGAGQ